MNDDETKSSVPVLSYGRQHRDPHRWASDLREEAQSGVLLAFFAALVPVLGAFFAVAVIFDGIRMYQKLKLRYGPTPYMIIIAGAVALVVNSLVTISIFL